MARITNVFYK